MNSMVIVDFCFLADAKKRTQNRLRRVPFSNYFVNSFIYYYDIRNPETQNRVRES